MKVRLSLTSTAGPFDHGRHSGAAAVVGEGEVVVVVVVGAVVAVW